VDRAVGRCESVYHKTCNTTQQCDQFLVGLERPHLEPESRLPIFTELSGGRLLAYQASGRTSTRTLGPARPSVRT
jgi:hypothetical protein